jgi:DNA-binding CsgD family transcriptional regulator
LAAEVSASISNSFYWTGELNEARRWALTRVDVATRGHDLFGMRHGHSWLAFVASSQGDWAEARELLDQAEAVLSRQNSPEPIGFLRVVRAFIHLRTGAAEAAYRDAREAIDLLLPLGDATVVWYASLLVLICLEAGRVSEARAEISHQERRLAAMPASSLPARSARAALAFAYVALGQADAAAACEEALAPYEGDYHWSPVRCSLAALARFRGDNGHALALLLRAAEQARAERQLPDLVAILVAHVELLPDSRERREMTLEAEQLAQELGMPPPFAGGRPAASTAAVPPPYSLTPRELEVLRLVAEGRTNRDIAAALVITERTVINHLGSVFAKIGVENRSAATAFAIRNGLTERGH